MKDNLNINLNIEGRKILIVEHNDRNYYSLERLFNHTGIKYLRVQSIKEAIRAALKGFDLVLMNVLVTDSFFAVKEMKRLKPELPVIVHSTVNIEEDNQKWIEAGCSELLLEPFQKEYILSKIKKCLRIETRKPEYVDSYF
jgi:CheY-like chemotaxis protein